MCEAKAPWMDVLDDRCILLHSLVLLHYERRCLCTLIEMCKVLHTCYKFLAASCTFPRRIQLGPKGKSYSSYSAFRIEAICSAGRAPDEKNSSGEGPSPNLYPALPGRENRVWSILLYRHGGLPGLTKQAFPAVNEGPAVSLLLQLPVALLSCHLQPPRSAALKSAFP